MNPARHSHTAPPAMEFVAIERDSDRSTNAVRRWTLVERTWRVVYVGAWTWRANCGPPTRAVREAAAYKLPKRRPRCGSTELKQCSAGEPGQ